MSGLMKIKKEFFGTKTIKLICTKTFFVGGNFLNNLISDLNKSQRICEWMLCGSGLINQDVLIHPNNDGGEREWQTPKRMKRHDSTPNRKNIQSARRGRENQKGKMQSRQEKIKDEWGGLREPRDGRAEGNLWWDREDWKGSRGLGGKQTWRRWIESVALVGKGWL